ncbi:hypothetical protein Cfor_01236 [Coptotermes formosanus]|uniref:Insulin-like domain-containing protein n=1 Tax=Coptotermes formosanus TaxID=36987 RepID=A0A6L2PAC4_COPFO|nr:hypothetical protein Cfor_01236 [Coptotermes formosanus]
MWRLCLSVVLIGVICVCALPENPSLMSKLVQKRETQQRLCGNNLVAILRLLCQSKYHGMFERRKRDTHMFHSRSPQDLDTLQWIQSQAEEEVPKTKFPFRSRSVANTFKNRSLRRLKRNSGGVADECCINKGCTLGELREYCAER